MQYYIDIGRKKRNTAGAKAPRDISEICRQRGMTCLVFIAGHCVIDDLSLSLYYNTFWFAGSIVMKNWHAVLRQMKPQKRKRLGRAR